MSWAGTGKCNGRKRSPSRPRSSSPRDGERREITRNGALQGQEKVLQGQEDVTKII